MPSARRAGASSRQRVPTKTSTAAKKQTVGSRGSKTRGRTSWETMSLAQQARCLVGSVRPLLELFAALDDVFTEDGAMTPEYRKISLGRCYEAWQKCRKAFDPDFVSSDYRRPRRRGPLASASHSRNGDNS